DKDVRRLEVAMHHQAAMRRLDRAGHLDEEAQALTDAEPPRVAIQVDRLALDELHQEERNAFGRDAAVEQAPDVGMIQRRQDLPLDLEAVQIDVGVETGSQQLERDLLLEFAVGPFREKDARHPPAAELTDDAIGTEAPPLVRDACLARLGEQRGRDRDRTRSQVRASRRVPTEQALDFAPDVVIAMTRFGDDRRPLRWLTFQRPVEHTLNAAPVVCVHLQPPERAFRMGADSWLRKWERPSGVSCIEAAITTRRRGLLPLRLVVNELERQSLACSADTSAPVRARRTGIQEERIVFLFPWNWEVHVRAEVRTRLRRVVRLVGADWEDRVGSTIVLPDQATQVAEAV